MTDVPRYFVFVALTGDEQIKAYHMDRETGALELSTTSAAHGPIGALNLHPCGDIAETSQIDRNNGTELIHTDLNPSKATVGRSHLDTS